MYDLGLLLVIAAVVAVSVAAADTVVAAALDIPVSLPVSSLRLAR